MKAIYMNDDSIHIFGQFFHYMGFCSNVKISKKVCDQIA